MSRIRTMRAALLCAAIAAALAVAEIGVPSHSGGPALAQEGSGQCGGLALTPSMPTKVLFSGAVDPQGSADCFAWQEFFYLNWAAQPGAVGLPDRSVPASRFGAPAATKGAMRATVWESYHDASELFPSFALRGVAALPRPGKHVLAATSEFDGQAVDLHGIQQATSGWLTDRHRHLTFYEVHVNNDEFQYISTNHLTTAIGQQRCVRSTYGLQLPAGSSQDHDCYDKAATYGQNFGAIELKAAWVALPDPKSWSKYLTAVADIFAPGMPPQRDVVVGLVGLHIIHKTPNQLQLNWATFEHIDNAPDANATPNPGARWTYNNPACNPQTDHYTCVPNTKPGTPCPAAAGTAGCDPYTAPVQVTRLTPIDDIASAENTKAWGLIGKANPASVFLNYELVQVQWPTAGSTPIAPGARVPLSAGSPLPRAPVANTTMETYIQPKTCFYCHQYAAIATPRPKGALGAASSLIVIPATRGLTATATAAPQAAFGSDFSFLLQKAH